VKGGGLLVGKWKNAARLKAKSGREDTFNGGQVKKSPCSRRKKQGTPNEATLRWMESEGRVTRSPEAQERKEASEKKAPFDIATMSKRGGGGAR